MRAIHSILVKFGVWGWCLGLAVASAEAAEAGDVQPVPVGYGDLPVHYRVLFEPGRQLEYELDERSELSGNKGQEVISKPRGVLTCLVAGVQSAPMGLVSEVKCNSDAIVDMTHVSPRGLVDGLWYATAEGLWRASPDDAMDPLHPEDMIVSAHPKASRSEEVWGEGGSSQETKWSNGNWCSSQINWGGDTRGNARCFSVRGIVSAQDEWVGGVASRLSLKLRPPQPGAGNPSLTYAQLPVHYRAMFEPGRQFQYQVDLHNKFQSPEDARADDDGTVDLTTPQGGAVCVVAEVSSHGDQLRSTVQCAIPEGDEWREISEPIVDGVWIATHKGLWKTNDLDAPLHPDARMMAPQPKEQSQERSDGCSIESSETTWSEGAWCAHRSSLRSEEEWCFANGGLASVSKALLGNDYTQVTFSLIKPMQMQSLCRH